MCSFRVHYRVGVDDDGLHALGLIGRPGQGTIGDDRLPAIVLDMGLVEDSGNKGMGY